MNERKKTKSGKFWKLYRITQDKWLLPFPQFDLAWGLIVWPLALWNEPLMSQKFCSAWNRYSITAESTGNKLFSRLWQLRLAVFSGKGLGNGGVRLESAWTQGLLVHHPFHQAAKTSGENERKCTDRACVSLCQATDLSKISSESNKTRGIRKNKQMCKSLQSPEIPLKWEKMDFLKRYQSIKTNKIGEEVTVNKRC